MGWARLILAAHSWGGIPATGSRFPTEGNTKEVRNIEVVGRGAVRVRAWAGRVVWARGRGRVGQGTGPLTVYVLFFKFKKKNCTLIVNFLRSAIL